MVGFIKYMRSEEAEFLLSYPNANHLFMVMAFRARRTDHPMNGLKAGQCFLGDHSAIGLTERQYRTAKKQLSDWNLATFKGTNKGTVGTIVNTKVYDINEELSDEQEDRQATCKRQASDEQATTNKECNNVNNGINNIPHFDYEVVAEVWNSSCEQSQTPSKKCRVVSEATKKNMPATYKKYCSIRKARGKDVLDRVSFCESYFTAVLNWGANFVGKPGPNENWKMNLEHASKIATYDKVAEWLAND